jgi:hypothetical protein
VALVHGESNGCGICSLLRVDASEGLTETVIAGLEANNLVVDPATRTAAIAGTMQGPGAETTHDEGVYVVSLEDLDGSPSPLRLHDGRCQVARWGADDLQYIWLPTYGDDACDATAFGLNGNTEPIDVDVTHGATSIAPNGTWRVLYGDKGWWLFDRVSTLRAQHETDGSGPVFGVSWRPDDGALYWLEDGQLWAAELPDGEPRPVADWPVGESPGLPGHLDVDLAWLQP